MKGRKGQVYSFNSTTIFKVFSCLTINIIPETNNEHSDKPLEVSVSAEEKLYSVVSKSVARRRSKIKIIVEVLQGHCIRLTHHKGLRKKTSLWSLAWTDQGIVYPTDCKAPDIGYLCALHLYSRQPQDWGSQTHSGIGNTNRNWWNILVYSTALNTSDTTSVVYENLKGSRDN